MKIILQQIWKANISWDEPITGPLFEKWKDWIAFLPNIQKIQIPRCHLPPDSTVRSTKIELHVFTDASEEAFAAVAYFRIVDGCKITVSLVGAKTKVAPQKPLSIPRLELQAALLGTRLAATIKNAHTYTIDQTTFWTDSKTVLSWLQADHRSYKQFVALRLGEILENSNMQQWRWISTTFNIADEATKWQRTPNFDSQSQWFTGPVFLHTPTENWPPNNEQLQPVKEELRPNFIQLHSHSTSPIDLSRFLSWLKLIRTKAFINRFLSNIKNKLNKTQPITGAITVKEYESAETELIKQSQIECYEFEILQLESDTKKISKNSTLYKLSPYLDRQRLLRVKGRVDAASCVGTEMKRPIILHRKHELTKLIIVHYHNRYHHSNNETVINEIRQKYYISRLRVTVRKIIKECQLCKNRKATPRTPEMADLPAARLSPFCRPFSFVGIDYFGPLYITVRRRPEKRWGVLFTCLTVRAIHIEIAHSLDTSSCIMCLSNFMSRRGVPVEIYSDNGTNFKGASSVISTELRNKTKIVSKTNLQQNASNGFLIRQQHHTLEEVGRG